MRGDLMMASVTSALRNAVRQLEKERERIDRQITAIRAVLDESGTARALASRATPSRPTPKRREMSAAARRAVSQRMKAYWEKRKAAAGKGKP
jgi:hypothetical protein